MEDANLTKVAKRSGKGSVLFESKCENSFKTFIVKLFFSSNSLGNNTEILISGKCDNEKHNKIEIIKIGMIWFALKFNLYVMMSGFVSRVISTC